MCHGAGTPFFGWQARLRKIALNIVGRDRTSKASVPGRRKMAAWNDDYILRIITAL